MRGGETGKRDARVDNVDKMEGLLSMDLIIPPDPSAPSPALPPVTAGFVEKALLSSLLLYTVTLAH